MRCAVGRDTDEDYACESDDGSDSPMGFGERLRPVQGVDS